MEFVKWKMEADLIFYLYLYQELVCVIFVCALNDNPVMIHKSHYQQIIRQYTDFWLVDTFGVKLRCKSVLGPISQTDAKLTFHLLSVIHHLLSLIYIFVTLCFVCVFVVSASFQSMPQWPFSLA